MPDRCAPTSAAMSCPSPVFTSPPRDLLFQVQPPVASTPAPARTSQAEPSWRLTARAPCTDPSPAHSSSSAGLWSRISTPRRRMRWRMKHMYCGAWPIRSTEVPRESLAAG